MVEIQVLWEGRGETYWFKNEFYEFMVHMLTIDLYMRSTYIHVYIVVL